ncbi:metal ABC transporter permease [Paenibacillus silvae]|uniref:metal ABC transporter permease n=1 Tax=Paenibacillus silvae TaxID=1325358 RepID=UPI0020041F44|nr:metal ABC transporter permease [Paenibacillus silvae]MCK6076303.1 metal ABC transporter permease [Paenibacillus silvae]MCK6078342.1 metal ABC transporter permease [Paenibacillus silvae]MCK6150538.1 metal ABC transporter permease [Paenibacillus silvae]MCK6268798.1 metal ABC transporter permease [Paenibacillus silvae]MCK6270391.1 metal ABC transporter permease [Paenibacillus silvae]
MSTFWIILTAVLVSSACAILGCFLILRRMALVGDAISHAVLPGIAIAFLWSGSRDSLWMLLGATVFGLLTVFFIQSLQAGGLSSDASIGIVFTALFAAGVILISLNAQHIDLDLDCVLFGEIAYVQWDTLTLWGMDAGPRAVWMLGITLLVILVVVGLFYKQFKLCAFDPALAAACGIPVVLFHYVLMGLVSMTSVASFESVGSILVVGMLIVPAAAAYLLTDQLGKMIVYAVLIGAASSVGGYLMAYVMDASIAGCMVAVAGILFVLALLLSPKHGIVLRYVRRKYAAR